MHINEYEKLDAVGMAELVRKKEVKPSELTEEAIRRVEQHNHAVNAEDYKNYEYARKLAAEQDTQIASGAAQGEQPFFGVPFLLKDILGDFEGWPTTIGSRMLQKRVLPKTCFYVDKLLKSGLVFLGKSNSPEYGILPTTENTLYGPARNPWNLDFSTGGSSGGAAAAVASGMFPGAHGNDGGVSIRIPASSCGVIGFKPTRARNSLGPDFGHIIAGFVDEHVLTRTVRDSAAFLDATQGHIPGDPYMSWPMTRPFSVEVGRDPVRLRIAYAKTKITGEPVQPGAPPQPGELEPLTQAVMAAGGTVSAPEFQLSEMIAQGVGREMARFQQTYDIWLTPTMPKPTIRNGMVDVNETDLEKAYANIPDYNQFCCIQNATGQPAVSLPLTTDKDGKPLGLMFSARNGEESTLFQLASQLEEAMPWKDRKAVAFRKAAAAPVA